MCLEYTNLNLLTTEFFYYYTAYMTKKILLTTDTTIIGGAEKHMLNLARFLDREKFKPYLFCGSHKNLDQWCKKMKELDVEVIRTIAKNKHNPRYYFGLKDAIEELDIDLIHAHIWNPASNRYAYLAAKATKKPLVITEHDPFILSPLKNWIKKRLLKNVTHVITVSEKNRELLRKNYPNIRGKITTIHNGLDTTWFESQLLSFSASERNQFREEEFKANEKTNVIACIAELHARKGLIHLINAAKILKEKDTPFKVIIVGKGPQQKKLEAQIKKSDLNEEVKLLGYQNEIPKILASSDFFVLPSLNEAFGLVLLEAMAAKLPIIATKNGGIPEIITNNITGILVPPGDGKSIAYAILRLLNDRKTAEKIAKNGYERVKKEFDIKTMVRKTEEVYAKVLTTKN